MQVRAVNSRGVVGAWSQALQHQVEGVSGIPPDVSIFIVSAQADGTRVAEFSLSDPPIDLAGYRIRYSTLLTDTWDDMTPLHDGLLMASPHEFNLLNEGDYRFAIKAYDRGGRESENAVYVIAELPAQRIGAVIRIDNPRGQGWPGTLTNAAIDESDNSLVGASVDTWDSVGSGDTLTETWFGDSVDAFTYDYTEVDLGAELLFTITVQGSPIYGSTVDVSVSHSVDAITYTPYESITGTLSARYVRVRITVTNTGDIPKLANLNIISGGDSITDQFRLLDTGSLTPEAGGGVRLPLRSAFQQITDVNVSLQSVGAGASWEFIDLDPTLGPWIKIYNGNDALIYPFISAEVRGV